MASAAPALRYQNVYGIDMPAREEFVAHQRSEEEVAKMIGADWLVYQSIEDLKKSCHEGNPHVTDFECSAFDGKYITGDVGADYLAKVSAQRSDASKRQKQLSLLKDTNVLDLHNHA
jgi:amidophosphoribosyltransferase